MKAYANRSITAFSLAVLLGLVLVLTVLLGLADVGENVLGQANGMPKVIGPLTIYSSVSKPALRATLTGTLSYTHHLYFPLILNKDMSPAWGLVGLDEIPIEQIVTSGYDTKTVYAVPNTSVFTGATLYKSSDGGESWHPSSNGIAGRVQSLFVHPMTSTMLLAGTLMGEGVYYSYDKGEHWGSSPMYPFVHAIAAHPTTPTLWLAATYNPSIWGSAYIHRTNNAGVMWYTVTSQPLIVNAFLFDSSDPTRVYACTAGGFKSSDDAGLTWKHVALSGCSDLVMHPYTSTIMYADNGNGVLKTNDSGVDWTSVLTPEQSVTAVALDPVNPNLVYAATLNTLFRSTNAGHSWQPVGCSTEMPFGYINDLAVDHSGRVYVGTDHGIWVVLLD